MLDDVQGVARVARPLLRSTNSSHNNANSFWKEHKSGLDMLFMFDMSFFRIILMGFSVECACFLHFYIRDLRGFYVTSTSMSSTQHTLQILFIYLFFFPWVQHIKREQQSSAIDSRYPWTYVCSRVAQVF